MATITQHHHLLTPSPWGLWFQQKKKLGRTTSVYRPMNLKTPKWCTRRCLGKDARMGLESGGARFPSLPLGLTVILMKMKVLLQKQFAGGIKRIPVCAHPGWGGWAGLHLAPVKQNCWGACGLAISACFIGWEELLPGITLSLMVRGPGPKRKSCYCHGVPMMLREWPVIKGLAWKEKTVCTEVTWPTVETVMSQRAGLFTTAFFAALENGK